jgi:hypothetical protein
MLDCRQITQPRSQAEQVVDGSVQEIAQRLHITMPEVWVYEAPTPTPSRDRPQQEQLNGGRLDWIVEQSTEQEVRAVLPTKWDTFTRGHVRDDCAGGADEHLPCTISRCGCVGSSQNATKLLSVLDCRSCSRSSSVSWPRS